MIPLEIGVQADAEVSGLRIVGLVNAEVQGVVIDFPHFGIETLVVGRGPDVIAGYEYTQVTNAHLGHQGSRQGVSQRDISQADVRAIGNISVAELSVSVGVIDRHTRLVGILIFGGPSVHAVLVVVVFAAIGSIPEAVQGVGNFVALYALEEDPQVNAFELEGTVDAEEEFGGSRPQVGSVVAVDGSIAVEVQEFDIAWFGCGLYEAARRIL